MKIEKGNIIKYLTQSDLHDVPINKIEMLFEKEVILFEFEKWNEAEKNYRQFIITLNNVSSFNLNHYGEDGFLIKELLEVNCKKINDEQFESTFIFHKGPDKALWKLEIIFCEIEIY